MNLVPIPAGVEQLLQLRWQHTIEWQNHLSAEVKARSALEVQHQSEMTRLLAEECHYSQRGLLARQQLQELGQLKEKNRAKRLMIRACQQQEQFNLEQLVATQNEAT